MSGYALIIEPDPNLAKRFQDVLSNTGLHLNIASNSQEGIEHVHTCPPDVIVLDHSLLNGEEARTQNYWCFKIHPRTQHIPIVVLTDQEQERSVGATKTYSVGDYTLPKNKFIPFTLFELLRFMEVV